MIDSLIDITVGTPSLGNNVTSHDWDGATNWFGTAINLTCPHGFAFENYWVTELTNNCSVIDGGIFWQYNDTRPAPICAPYCNDTELPGVPFNASMSRSQVNSSSGQVVSYICNVGYEFLGSEAVTTPQPVGPPTTTTTPAPGRRKRSTSEILEQIDYTCATRQDGGGYWSYDHTVLTACVRVSCTNDTPARSDVNITAMGDNKYLATIDYVCAEHGQEFRRPDQQFYDKFTTTCQANASWGPPDIEHPCEYRYCLNPHIPPGQHNLSVCTYGSSTFLKPMHYENFIISHNFSNCLNFS